MGKRKAVETAVVASPPKVSKKNKKRQQDVVQPPVEVTSPKKHKSKSKKLEKSFSPPLSTPKKKNKANNSRYSLNTNAVDGSSPKSLKKLKEHIMSPVHMKQESDSENEVAIDPSPLSEANEQEVDLMEIPKDDLIQLLTGIKKLLPGTETMAPRNRAKKLRWESVAFGDYTADRCSKIWDAILRRQRQYRFMSELVEDAMVWLETPWKTAKSKKNSKHPEFPKRPKTSFLHYIDDIKAALLQANKDVKITEIARIAGQKFKLLSDDERLEYINRAAQGMKKYEEKVEQFYQKYPHLKVEVAPKKPRPPFNIFLDDHLNNEEHVADKIAYRMASKEAWNNLKDKKKLKWIRLAIAEHENYVQEVEAYNAEHPEEPVKAVKSVLNKEDLLILHKAEGRPIKPPKSAYILYTQSVMKDGEFAMMGARERVKAIGAKWAQVPKTEKEKYEKKLQQMHDKYKVEIAAYLNKLPDEERLKIQNELEKKKEPKEKKKRKSISKREITIDAIPKLWGSMSADDKELYKNALDRVKNYFEEKLNVSIKEDVPVANAGEDDVDDDEEDDNEPADEPEKDDDSDEDSEVSSDEESD